MGNRHHHKKQRARVRAVMAESGESYQQALARLRAGGQESTRAAAHGVDLLCVDYFGARVTLATFQLLESLSCVVVPSSRTSGVPGVSQQSPLLALAGPRIVH